MSGDALDPELLTPMAASLTAFGAAPTGARVTIAAQTVGRRVARALRVLGGLWGAAVLAVFIPIAHFVLVPTLLVLGAVLGALRMRQDRVIVSVVGPCPRCGRAGEFPLDTRRVTSQKLTCPGCHTNVDLTLDAAAAGPASS
jgi:hypothetical protein